MQKILIVDDEPNLVELEKSILEGEGFEVLTAGRGDEALKILETVTPDIVILDMMMPGMSGREVCEKIRGNPKTKELKVIFITVARFSDIGKEVLNTLHVSGYITKPFENEDLVKQVKEILSK